MQRSRIELRHKLLIAHDLQHGDQNLTHDLHPRFTSLARHLGSLCGVNVLQSLME